MGTEEFDDKKHFVRRPEQALKKTYDAIRPTAAQNTSLLVVF